MVNFQPECHQDDERVHQSQFEVRVFLPQETAHQPFLGHPAAAQLMRKSFFPCQAGGLHRLVLRLWGAAFVYLVRHGRGVFTWCNCFWNNGRDRAQGSWYRDHFLRGRSLRGGRRRYHDSSFSESVLRRAKRIIMNQNPVYKEFMGEKESEVTDVEFMRQGEMLAPMRGGKLKQALQVSAFAAPVTPLPAFPPVPPKIIKPWLDSYVVLSGVILCIQLYKCLALIGCLSAVLGYGVHNGAVVVMFEVVAGAVLWSAVRREACPPPPHLPVVYQGPLETVGMPWSLACAASICPSAWSSSSSRRSRMWQRKMAGSRRLTREI